MYSTAGFNAGRLTGSWVQVGEVTHHPGCGPGQMSLTPTETELVIDWQLCLDGRLTSGHGNLTPKGDGRFAVPGSDVPWWVLWADADERTLVLGTPSGAFGIVLDRGKIPADRAKAATDILAWNGYDISLLHLP
jgi:apolipoprotein D and lipocalin family protein